MSDSDYYQPFISQYLRTHIGAPSGFLTSSVLLYGFDTGLNVLKPEHRRGLNRHIYPHVSQEASVWVCGMASPQWRVGPNANQELSIQRAITVADEIDRRAQGLVGSISIAGRGELAAVSPFVDAASDRAVAVMVFRNAVPVLPPPRIQRPPPPPPTPDPPSSRPTRTRYFRIRLLGGIEGGAAVVGGDYHFEIDYKDSPAAPRSAPVEYSMVGLGGGLSIPRAPPVPSVAGLSPWNRFATEVACTTADFGGRASIGNLTLPVVYSETNVSLFPNNNGPIHLEQFRTGGSLSIGGYSRIYGAFFRTGF